MILWFGTPKYMERKDGSLLRHRAVFSFWFLPEDVRYPLEAMCSHTSEDMHTYEISYLWIEVC